ncbi:Nhac na:h antiporter, partial [Globisporangium splendens]
MGVFHLSPRRAIAAVYALTTLLLLAAVASAKQTALLELNARRAVCLCTVYPRYLSYSLEDSNGVLLKNGTFETLDAEGNYNSAFTQLAKQLAIGTYGTHTITTTVTAIPAPLAVGESNGNGTANVSSSEAETIVPFSLTVTSDVFVTPGWVSLLPPLVTLVMSAVLSQVLIALLAGIWCGATIVAQGNPFVGFLRTFDQYWVNAFVDDGHAGVLLFTIILGGTIGVVQKGGGGHGLALLAKEYMTTSLRMQLSTWLLCLLIFFDDYSCILIIGNSLRQVLSQTGVSREKFAAIIHVIGVCLPSMAPVSSWIGVEIGYVSEQLRELKLDWDPFVTCLSCLHYRFFPILFIGFIFITIICEKDFGPMVQFEKDAAASPIQTGYMTPVDMGPCASPVPELGPLEPDTKKPMRWQNAVFPFVTIIVLTFSGMILDGYSRLCAVDPDGSYGLLDALSNCNSVSALIRASAAGWALAVAMLLLQRIVTLDEATKAWMEGVKDVLDPTLVLILAWALGTVIGEVNVAQFIATAVGDAIQKQYIPAIASLLCFVVSFATGSSFGTMAIMFPIISPLSYSISGGDASNLRQCFGAILGSSVFGNICSPIADTSILAALAANIPLQSHIRSILPYALLVGVVSLVGGTLPTGMNLFSTFTAFGACLAVLLLVVFFCGTRVNSRYRALSSCSFLSASPPSSKYNNNNGGGSSGENRPLLSA